MKPFDEHLAIDPSLQAILASLFVARGSRYYLAVATLTGELLEGKHFYYLDFARCGFSLLLQESKHKDHLIALYDFAGKVLFCQYQVASNDLLGAELGYKETTSVKMTT